MSKNLYFIPIIARALEESDPQAALRNAFNRILTMGREPAYEEGLIQFRAFMHEVRDGMNAGLGSVGSTGDLLTTELALELATDTFQGDEAQRQAALDLVMSHPDGRKIYETLREQWPAASRIELVLEKADDVAATIAIDSVPGSAEVKNIGPGSYRLSHASGRVLWEETLHEEDLLWAQAYPGRPLELAADSGDGASTPPTREVFLFGGEIALRLYPGLESGSLDIQVQRKEGA